MPRIVLRRACVCPSFTGGRRPLSLLYASAAAVALLATPAMLGGFARADVPIENIVFSDENLQRYARGVGRNVNGCNRREAEKGIAELKSILRGAAGELLAGANPVDLARLPDVVKLLERELENGCGKNVLEVRIGISRLTFGFFFTPVRDLVQQQLNAVKVGGKVDDAIQTLRAQEANIKQQAEQRSAQQGRAQYEGDSRALGSAAKWLQDNKAEIEKNPKLLETGPPGQTPGTAPPGPGASETKPGEKSSGEPRQGSQAPLPPGPNLPPGAPGSPIQTRPVNYAYGDPNAPPGYKLEITGGAHWHEVRKLLYGTVITQAGVPGTEKAFLRSDETISGGALGLNVSAPGRVLGLADDWRAIVRLSGEWASGRTNAHAEPGTIDTARRYFFPAANGSTGVDYGGTGMFSSIETDFHRFRLDAMLGRRLGGVQINGGRVDFGAAFGVIYQYTHIGHDVWENNVTFPDIGSWAGFYTTDHVFGPQVGGRVSYTNGPFNATLHGKFAPTLVVGHGTAMQTNRCPNLCPAAEQNFTQSVSDSRTAFNARLTFGANLSYQLFQGVRIGAHTNVTYNSNVSGWKFSPNPLKGPPTLRGGSDLGIVAGVTLTMTLR